MLSRFGYLRNKEMICTKDGMKIGYVDDVEFDAESFQITHLIAYGKTRLFGLLGRYDDIRISCDQIDVIGEDIILVKEYAREGKIKTSKEGFLQKFFE